MNFIPYAIAAILGIALFLGLCWMVVKIQMKVCEDCPHQKECNRHQCDENFTPKCYRSRMKDTASLTDNPTL